MEATLELCNNNNNKDYHHEAQMIMKGKRTKRPRLPSPLRLTMASATSSSHDSGGGGGGFNLDMAATTSTDHHPLTKRESTEEEEDMAKCLILLAQGHTRTSSSSDNNNNYQCKTCDRCFPSFQALGGHRASHKKPKPNNITTESGNKTLKEQGTNTTTTCSSGVRDRDDDPTTTTSTILSLQISPSRPNLYTNNNNKINKVHECSICGAEFSSGQALGGHMRRHRSFVNTPATSSSPTTAIISESNNNSKPTNNVFKLDLNLPAPDDNNHDHRDPSNFSFHSSNDNNNLLVFSASSLVVDCHY